MRDDARSRDNRSRARANLTSETWSWILVAVGVLLRILEYSDNRQLYFDEQFLQKNLVGVAFYDFQTPLSERQLAPPGFLAVERLIILLPLPFSFAARLVPFLCSIASMFLMRSVARRYLTATAVPIAVGLFAVTDWILYYSVEIKQYASDVALALAALLLSAVVAQSQEERAYAISHREFVLFTSFGAIGVWFSHPLALVLAGVGAYFIMKAAVRGDWRGALAFLAMSIVWAVSFAGCYKVSRDLVSKDGFLESWWGFAFLPFPPRSLADLKQTFWQTINLFNSPSGVVTPLGVLPSAFIGLALFLLGAWSLGRRWKGGLILLAAPIFTAIVVSMLRQYPFHGRLLLFLVPSVHLLVGEGAAALSRPGGAKLALALAAFLLAQPVCDVFWYRLIQKRNHVEFDSHADLHPDLLDYLERLERARSQDEATRRGKSDRLDSHERSPTDDAASPSPP
jgi:hypothetical protein